MAWRGPKRKSVEVSWAWFIYSRRMRRSDGPDKVLSPPKAHHIAKRGNQDSPFSERATQDIENRVASEENVWIGRGTRDTLHLAWEVAREATIYFTLYTPGPRRIFENGVVYTGHPHFL